MTTITNLVVALMIVTTGEEQVLAVPVREIPHEGGVYESFSFERETLWRKVNQTNFVFSAMIDTPVLGVCPATEEGTSYLFVATRKSTQDDFESLCLDILDCRPKDDGEEE